MASFEIALKFALEDEGGYSNNVADPGGETYKGISRKFWFMWQGWRTVDAIKKQIGPILDRAGIERLNLALEANTDLDKMVSDFYRMQFWSHLFDQIESQAVATKIFDERVNLSMEAISCLQQALVALGFPIAVDGHFGFETLQAVNSADPAELLPRFVDALCGHYQAEATKKPSKKVFLAGWLNRAKKIPS